MVLELLTGVVALFTAIITLALFLLGRQKVKAIEEKVSKVQVIEEKAQVIEEKLDEVHVLVNSRLTAVLDRVDQLTAVLEASNVKVPAVPRTEKYIR